MIVAVDQDTGRTVYGLDALACRFKRVLTTQMNERVKRRQFGNRALNRLGKNQTPHEAMIVQNLSIEALMNPHCGLPGVVIERCKATATDQGFQVKVWGSWQGQDIELSTNL